MNKKRAIPWWGWLVWIVVVVIGAIAFSHLPARVPTHFNLAGEANRYSSRFWGVVYEPLLMLVIMLLWHVLWRIDPKKRNYESFWSTYRYIGGIIVVCMGLIYLTVLGHLLHFATMRFALTAYGIMFMLIANVMPRLRPNWWMGVRTPWTLSSEESWNRTHRLSGQLGVPMGILIIILAWVIPIGIGKLMVLAAILPVIIWALIAVVASYFYAKIE
jgi:uncharacterized membrane protein